MNEMTASNSSTQDLFEKIVSELYQQGYCILPNALPHALAVKLQQEAQHHLTGQYASAGVGRKADLTQEETVRNDQIVWISDETEVGREWLAWCETIRSLVNQRLMLGLFSFESHFAHYPAGHFYKRHVDAFRGQTNRMLSLVTYLNNDWQAEFGGELVLYQNNDDTEGTRVLPELGTVVLFLSEEFPHEVLPASQDRYSIAGWFRVNSSSNNRIDPPE